MGYRRVIVETSMDSFMSAFSSVHFGQPGLGDKMFDNPGGHGPLTSISTEFGDSHRPFRFRTGKDFIFTSIPPALCS